MRRAAWMLPALGCAVGVVVLADANSDRWFEEITRKAGINHRHTNREFKNPYAKIMAGYTALGASVAVADYDGDGFDDVFTTDSSAGGKNRLYHNNHNLTFTDVAEAAGVANGNDETNATADALWFDFNNDGRPDLFIVRFGQNQLYQNLGNGKFKEITKQAGLTGYFNAITAIAFDYDHDGYLDLMVGNYFQPINLFNPNTPRFFPESFETAQNGGGVTLWHNNHDGTFTDVTVKAGLKQSGWTLDVGHGDADNDGWDDLYVACDFGTDRFFHNKGDGTFEEITEKAIGFDTKKGMNVDWGDYDNDGFLDIYVTNITDDYMREGNFLWHNNGNLTFSDVARETGTYDTGWGWGAKFFDYDNDGWADIYVMNGWVSAGKDSYVPDIFEMITRPGIDFADARNWPAMGGKSLSGYQKKRLFHNERGQIFKDEAPRHGMDSQLDGRGIGIADFDNDGRLDVFAANASGEPKLYHNCLPPGPHWVQFLLEGRKSNRTAVGAQVRLTAGGETYLSFVNGGNGFAGQSTLRVHFGLGKQAVIDRAEIRWPSGVDEVYTGLAADKLHKIVEGNGKKASNETCDLTIALALGLAGSLSANDMLYEQGQKALAAKDWDKGIGLLENALASDPDNLKFGSEYRQAVLARARAMHPKDGQPADFDRSLKFFEKLTADHGKAANAYLNYGFAYVDKMPAAGAITQVILANTALSFFSKSIELKPTWIAYYTRGNSFLFWPKIFGKAKLGVADLEECMKIQRATGKKPYYVRAYVSLGDGYWKMDDLDKAKAVWSEGLKQFPDSDALRLRVSKQGDDLKAVIDDSLDPNKRVDTNLKDLWMNP